MHLHSVAADSDNRPTMHRHALIVELCHKRHVPSTRNLPIVSTGTNRR